MTHLILMSTIFFIAPTLSSFDYPYSPVRYSEPSIEAVLPVQEVQTATWPLPGSQIILIAVASVVYDAQTRLFQNRLSNEVFLNSERIFMKRVAFAIAICSVSAVAGVILDNRGLAVAASSVLPVLFLLDLLVAAHFLRTRAMQQSRRSQSEDEII